MNNIGVGVLAGFVFTVPGVIECVIPYHKDNYSGSLQKGEIEKGNSTSVAYERDKFS